LGNFEVLHYWWIVQNLAVIIIFILTSFSYKNLLERFGILKNSRKDYYECGFRPHIQNPIQVSIQFIFICIFFVVYDIELVFSFPLVSSLVYVSLIDLTGFLLIYLTLLISLVYDFNNNLLNWKFS